MLTVTPVKGELCLARVDSTQRVIEHIKLDEGGELRKLAARLRELANTMESLADCERTTLELHEEARRILSGRPKRFERAAG